MKTKLSACKYSLTWFKPPKLRMSIPEKPGWLTGRRSVTVVVTVAQRAYGQPEQPRNLQRAAERRAGGPCAVPAVAPSVRPAGPLGALAASPVPAAFAGQRTAPALPRLRCRAPFPPRVTRPPLAPRSARGAPPAALRDAQAPRRLRGV